MHKPLPPVEMLWDRFDYKPLTGQLIWRVAPSNKPWLLNKPAGYKSSSYVWIRLACFSYSPFVAHRIAWAWVAGEDPGQMEVDHVDMNRQNNRWNNLRLANNSQQTANTRKRKGTSSKYKGVCITTIRGKQYIIASITVNGVKKHLGCFDTEEAAHEAWKVAALKANPVHVRLQ